MVADVRGQGLPSIGPAPAEPVRAELEAVRGRPNGEPAARIRAELADVMMDKCGVFRDGTMLSEALAAVRENHAFAINYLPKGREDLAREFGGSGTLKGADRFAAARPAGSSLRRSPHSDSLQADPGH